MVEIEKKDMREVVYKSRVDGREKKEQASNRGTQALLKQSSVRWWWGPTPNQVREPHGA